MQETSIWNGKVLHMVYINPIVSIINLYVNGWNKPTLKNAGMGKKNNCSNTSPMRNPHKNKGQGWT